MKSKSTNCRCCLIKLTSKNRSGTSSRCKSCHNAYQREYFKTYKDEHNEIMKKWRAKNKDKVSIMHKKYVKRTDNIYVKLYQKKGIEALSDRYIVSLIKKNFLSSSDVYVKTNEIPSVLIDLQRTRLALSRKIK